MANTKLRNSESVFFAFFAIIRIAPFRLNRAVLVVADYGAAGNFFHHAINVEAARFLRRWKFPEALQPPGDVKPCGREQEDVVHEPVVVVHTFIFGAFKWIGAQIFDQGVFLFLSSPITNKTLWLKSIIARKT